MPRQRLERGPRAPPGQVVREWERQVALDQLVAAAENPLAGAKRWIAFLRRQAAGRAKIEASTAVERVARQHAGVPEQVVVTFLAAQAHVAQQVHAAQAHAAQAHVAQAHVAWAHVARAHVGAEYGAGRTRRRKKMRKEKNAMSPSSLREHGPETLKKTTN